jgi:glycosyltransferase involved in cell wall biosynthesis
MTGYSTGGPEARSEEWRVLVIAPTPFFSDRGCHVRILEEIRAAGTHGYRFTVCTYHLGKDVEGLPVRRSLNVPWYRKLSAGPSIHKLYLDVLLLYTCWRTAMQVRPHLIHAHLHEGIVIGKVVSWLCGVPLVGDLQGSLVGELVQHGFITQGSVPYRLFAALERWIVRWPNHLVLSSDRATEGVAAPAQLAVPTTIVEDGVDEHVFVPRQPGEDLRARLGLDAIPGSRKIIGFLGVLSEYQGVDVLLEAARLVVARHPDVHFLIMGYPNVEQYRSRAAALGLSGHVTLPGRIPYAQARDYIAACDIAFSAKKDVTEANGKLLNYMAVGLPTVATDTRVNRQVLGDDAALYAQVDDAVSLAEAVLLLLHDEVKAKAMGAAARARVVTKFSWSVNGRKLTTVYAHVRRGRPAMDRASRHPPPVAPTAAATAEEVEVN